jgi:iron complex outermembrane receptor protein
MPTRSPHAGRTAQAARGSAVAIAVSLACLAAQAPARAQAQSQDASGLETVTVTGSRIKRLDDAPALPVQTISREDILDSGVSTAAELLKSVSAMTAPLTDGASITDSTSGQRGFNGANLRGIGVSGTLVLLNGRRMANFASPGDNAGVDLNNIPAGAIERVEVLKDGASAIYGTDAIGGVINFITRTDYEGIDGTVYVSATDQGGAGKTTATLSAGYGNLADDRFNVFGVLDYQQLDALRSSQRDFIRERPLAERLPALMSSNTYPANVDLLNSAQRNALIAAGLLPAGTTSNRFNPSEPTGCNPPATLDVDLGPGGRNGCSFDYMRDTEIFPESTRLSFLGRATVQVAEEHRVYFEGLYAETVSDYVLSPVPQRIRNLPVSILPEPYRTALSAPGLPATLNGIRLRMAEAGNRTSEVTSEATRLVLGLEGRIGEWDYDTAVVRADNSAVDKYTNGYTLYDEFVAGVAAGIINPFGESSPAGQDLIRSLRVRDEARQSEGTTTSIDASVTRSLMQLGGGDLGLALGAEYRKEEQEFKPSALLVSNNIAGDRSSSGVNDIEPFDADRNVFSAYAEFNAPLTRELELQFALRYDDYSDAGDTVNPKLGARWQPTEWLLLRGSAGTGFRAPSLSDLNRPTIYGVTSSLITDPQCVAVEGSIDFCTDQWPVERRSNPDLEPEESTQYSFGVVVEPAGFMTASVDYWNIKVDEIISTLGEQIIIESPDKYNGTFIERDADGFITNVLLFKDNQGELKTSGIDVGAELRSNEYDFGSFSVSLTGTYVLEYERQFGPLEPFRSNLGRFLNDQTVQRWRHRLAFGWDYSDFAVQLANNYSSGYRDHNVTYDPVTDTPLPDRDVAAYSLWDLTGSWQALDALTVRAGVLNLADEMPPFSNQAYYFLASYDPSHTDPRGRTYFLSLSYAFR